MQDYYSECELGPLRIHIKTDLGRSILYYFVAHFQKGGIEWDVEFESATKHISIRGNELLLREGFEVRMRAAEKDFEIIRKLLDGCVFVFCQVEQDASL